MAQADATRLLARIAGPYLLLTGLAAVVRRADMPALLHALQRDPALEFSVASLTLLVGLVMVAFHNRWSGPLEIAVSLLGWLLVVRGVIWLLAFNSIAPLVQGLVASSVFVSVVGLIVAVLGIAFTVAGFRGRAAAL